MYLLPGFIDMHGHIGDTTKGRADYVYKLWMAHGITTIRDPSCGNGLKWVLKQKEDSKKNKHTTYQKTSYFNNFSLYKSK